MKMSGAIFWGSILLIIGLTMIVNVVFKINLPVFRIVIATVFIFIGIKLLLGRHVRVFGHESTHCTSTFQHMKNNDAAQEFNVVFSKGNVDLRSVNVDGAVPVNVQVHTVFGSSTILLQRDTPVRIKSNTAFAAVDLPNAQNVVVGSTSYQSDSLDLSKGFLDLELDVVFGNTKVVFY